MKRENGNRKHSAKDWAKRSLAMLLTLAMLMSNNAVNLQYVFAGEEGAPAVETGKDLGDADADTGGVEKKTEGTDAGDLSGTSGNTTQKTPDGKPGADDTGNSKGETTSNITEPVVTEPSSSNNLSAAPTEDDTTTPQGIRAAKDITDDRDKVSILLDDIQYVKDGVTKTASQKENTISIEEASFDQPTTYTLNYRMEYFKNEAGTRDLVSGDQIKIHVPEHLFTISENVQKGELYSEATNDIIGSYVITDNNVTVSLSSDYDFNTAESLTSIFPVSVTLNDNLFQDGTMTENDVASLQGENSTNISLIKVQSTEEDQIMPLATDPADPTDVTEKTTDLKLQLSDCHYFIGDTQKDFTETTNKTGDKELKIDENDNPRDITKLTYKLDFDLLRDHDMREIHAGDYFVYQLNATYFKMDDIPGKTLVTADGTTIGIYSISQSSDGRNYDIKVTFAEGIEDLDEVGGWVSIEAKLNANNLDSSDPNGTTVPILVGADGKTTNITFPPVSTKVDGVEKKGVWNPEDNSITYTVEVGGKNPGVSLDSVILTDIFDSKWQTYIPGSAMMGDTSLDDGENGFQVTENESGGQTTCQYSFPTNAVAPQTITYKTYLSEDALKPVSDSVSGSVSNTASINSNDNPDVIGTNKTDTETVTYPYAKVKKSGTQLDSNSMKWTLDVNDVTPAVWMYRAIVTDTLSPGINYTNGTLKMLLENSTWTEVPVYDEPQTTTNVYYAVLSTVTPESGDSHQVLKMYFPDVTHEKVSFEFETTVNRDLYMEEKVINTATIETGLPQGGKGPGTQIKWGTGPLEYDFNTAFISKKNVSADKKTGEMEWTIQPSTRNTSYDIATITDVIESDQTFVADSVVIINANGMVENPKNYYTYNELTQTLTFTFKKSVFKTINDIKINYKTKAVNFFNENQVNHTYNDTASLSVLDGETTYNSKDSAQVNLINKFLKKDTTFTMDDVSNKGYFHYVITVNENEMDLKNVRIEDDLSSVIYYLDDQGTKQIVNMSHVTVSEPSSKNGYGCYIEKPDSSKVTDGLTILDKKATIYLGDIIGCYKIHLYLSIDNNNTDAAYANKVLYSSNKVSATSDTLNKKEPLTYVSENTGTSGENNTQMVSKSAVTNTADGNAEIKWTVDLNPSGAVLPDNTYLEDTIPAGLKFDRGSIVVKKGTHGATGSTITDTTGADLSGDCVITYTANPNGSTTIKIVLPKSGYSGNEKTISQPYRITYSTDIVGNFASNQVTNHAVLYGNANNNIGEADQTATVDTGAGARGTTKVKFKLKKLDSLVGTSDRLKVAGIHFGLYEDVECQTLVDEGVTLEDGTCILIGKKSTPTAVKSYYIHEIESDAGYVTDKTIYGPYSSETGGIINITPKTEANSDLGSYFTNNRIAIGKAKIKKTFLDSDGNEAKKDNVNEALKATFELSIYPKGKGGYSLPVVVTGDNGTYEYQDTSTTATSLQTCTTLDATFGEINISGLPWGVYGIKEIGTASGFGLDGTERFFEVGNPGTDEGPTTTTYFFGTDANSSNGIIANKSNKVTLSKYETGTTTFMNGATLEIRTASNGGGNIVNNPQTGIAYRYATNASTAIELYNLPAGTYYLHENVKDTATDPTLTLAEDIKFTIASDGTLARDDALKVTGNNLIMYDDTVKITVKKQDQFGQPVIGAKIKITDKNDNNWKPIALETTAENKGVLVFLPLKRGHTYTITETTTPSGYFKAEEITVQITADGKYILMGEGSSSDPGSYEADTPDSYKNQWDGSQNITTVLMRDVRKLANAVIWKVDNDTPAVGVAGCKFSLYKKGTSPDTEIASNLTTVNLSSDKIGIDLSKQTTIDNSDTNTKLSEGLSVGTYYFIETYAPPEYEKPSGSEKYEFTVTDTDITSMADMGKSYYVGTNQGWEGEKKSAPENYTGITNKRISASLGLHKYDGTSLDPNVVLPGAQFTLSYALPNDNNQETIVGPYTIESTKDTKWGYKWKTTGTWNTNQVLPLQRGFYTLTETKVPDGYLLHGTDNQPFQTTFEVTNTDLGMCVQIVETGTTVREGEVVASYTSNSTKNQSALTASGIQNTPTELVLKKTYDGLPLLNTKKSIFTIEPEHGKTFSDNSTEKKTVELNASTELKISGNEQGLITGINYIIKETSTADGYRVLPKPVVVKMDERGELAIVTSGNVKDQSGSDIPTNYYASDGKNSDVDYLDVTTSTSDINGSGSLKSLLTIDNKPISITLEKVGQLSGETSKTPVTDAQFSLSGTFINASGTQESKTFPLLRLDATGHLQLTPASLEGRSLIQNQTYTLTETRRGDGYVLPSNGISFQINATGEVTRITDTNTPAIATVGPTVDSTEIRDKLIITNYKIVGSAELQKKDDKGNSVNGASFDLYKKGTAGDSKVNTSPILSENGLVSAENLSEGIYYFIETATIPSCVLDATTKYYFSINAEGADKNGVMPKVTNFYDNKDLSGNTKSTAVNEVLNCTLKLHKYTGTDTSLAGAQFYLEYKEFVAGSYAKVGTYTTGTDGYLKDASGDNISLNRGFHRLTETVAAPGYKLLGTYYDQPFSCTFTVTNAQHNKVENIVASGASLTGSSDEIANELSISGNTVALTTTGVKNEPISITLKKIGEGDDSSGLENAVFTIKGNFAEVHGDTTTGVNKTLTLNMSGKDSIVMDSSSLKDGAISYQLISGEEYTLVETTAPAGYQKHSDVTFTMNENGNGEIDPLKNENQTGVTVSDNHLMITIADVKTLAGIKLKKTGVNADVDGLNGVTFQLYKQIGENQNPAQDMKIGDARKTHTDGTEKGVIQVDNLEEGTYYFKEIATLDDYYLNESSPTTESIEITQVDGVKEVVKNLIMTNAAFTDATLILEKLDKTDNSKLKNAEFELEWTSPSVTTNKKWYKLTTNEGGLAQITGTKTSENAEYTLCEASDVKLPKGNYSLKETKAPTGYDLNVNEKAFTCTFSVTDANNGGTLTIDKTTAEKTGTENPFKLIVSGDIKTSFMTGTDGVYNTRTLGSFRLTKKDVDDDQILIDGAEFTLTKPDTTTQVYTTGSDAEHPGMIIIEDLPWGEYTITETKAAPGYSVETPAPSYTFTIGATNLNETYSATNEKNKIAITKTDLQGNNLTGAVFSVAGSFKNSVSPITVNTTVTGYPDTFNPLKGELKATTNTTASAVEGKDLFTYTITEITAPLGYEIPAQTATPMTFTVDINGTVTVKSNGGGTGEYVMMTASGSDISIKDQPIEITLKKQANTTANTPLKNIQFTLTSSNDDRYPATGANVKTVTTNNSGEFVFAQGTDKVGFIQGKTYTLTETSDYDDYHHDGTYSITFTVGTDGKIALADGKDNKLPGTTDNIFSLNTAADELTVNNQPMTASLSFQKVDALSLTTGLQGTTFKLTYAPTSNGSLGTAPDYTSQTYTTDKDGVLTITGLIKGSYTIKETAPTTGYTMGAEPFEATFTVGNNDFGTTLGMSRLTVTKGSTLVKDGKLTNTRLDGAVILKKVDSADQKPLPGVTFGVYANGGTKIQEGTTGADGTLTFSGLSWGEYYVQEISTAKGYVLSGEQHKVSIGQYSQYVDLKTITNTKNAISLKKTDASGNAIAGAKFTITGTFADGSKTYDWTSTTAAQTVTGLFIAGQTYTMTETQAPAGHLAATKPVTFTVNADGTVTLGDNPERLASADSNGLGITMKNTSTTVSIQKVDEDGKTLAGASLAIRDSSGKIVAQWTSGTDAYTVSGVLNCGESYTLCELSAPSGYQVAEDIKFTMPASGTHSLTMTDKKVKAGTVNGNITVTKLLYTDDQPFAIDGLSFYTALFSDAALTNRVSEVKELAFTGSYNTTATFTNLALGTYYVAETDADGNVYDGSDFDITIEVTGQECTLTKAVPHGSAVIKNSFATPPDGYYMSDGEITITKKVVSSDGKAATVKDETFYVTLYSDEDMQEIVAGPEAIEIQNGSSGSVTFAELAQGTYYLAETDENGIPVDADDDTFGYKPSFSDSVIVIDSQEQKEAVTLTNTMKKQPTATATPTTKTTYTSPARTTLSSNTTTTSTATNAKTGDETDLMLYLFLLTMAAGAALTTVIARRKRGNEK